MQEPRLDALTAPLRDARVETLLAEAERDPSRLETHLALARAYNARCMPEEARRACDEVLARDPSHPEAWHETVIAASFAPAGTLEALRPAVENLARTHEDAAWAQRNLALLAYYQGRDDETRAACERAIASDPDDARCHEILAFLAYTLGDLDDAVEAGIKAVELDPKSYRALHWLGECYVKLGARDQAVRYFRRALAMEDCHFLALESLGSLCVSEPASLAVAWQCFGRMLAVNPRYFPAWFHLADAFIQQERFDEAAGMAAAVLQLSPDAASEADARQYLGLVALMQARPDAARPHFERALEIDSGFAAAHHYLGVLHEQQGSLGAAESSYRRAIAADADYALPRVRLGYLCFDRKEYESARRHFESALAVDEEEYLAHLGLGEIARWRKDYRAQLDHCRRAADVAPDDSNVRNQLGTAYDALGETEKAAHEYEEALRLDPWDRQAANNLGYLRERELKACAPADAARLRALAVAAWKRRLLICRDTRSSMKGARAHLTRLGVPAADVREWLEQERIA